METSIQIFNNPDFGDVRAVELDGEPYFVGKDVAVALKYANPRDALAKHVPDKYKRVSQIATPSGVQNMTLISEAGLYKLVMRSKLPNAEKFSDWACEEVLPSIRKHGLYISPNAPINPDILIKIGNDMKALQKERDAALAKVVELTPDAEYCRLILQSKEALPITVIAKDYGYAPAAFNELLKVHKIHYKRGNTWVLFQEYVGKNYTDTVTKTLKNGLAVTHTYWTQKGRQFLYEKLKADNILPLCEQRELTLF